MAAAAAVGGRSAYYGTEGGRAPKRLKTDGTDDNVAASAVSEGVALRLSERYCALCGALRIPACTAGLLSRWEVAVLCTMEGLTGIFNIISHNMYSSLLLVLPLIPDGRMNGWTSAGSAILTVREFRADV